MTIDVRTWFIDPVEHERMERLTGRYTAWAANNARGTRIEVIEKVAYDQLVAECQRLLEKISYLSSRHD